MIQGKSNVLSSNMQGLFYRIRYFNADEWDGTIPAGASVPMWGKIFLATTPDIFLSGVVPHAIQFESGHPAGDPRLNDRIELTKTALHSL